jgi:HSP20 family protein
MTKEIVEKKQVHSILPAVNITETPTSYIVTLDVPGAVKENIKAHIENAVLIVTADIADANQHEETKHSRQYHREFALANNIDVNTVDAQYDLGVLTVTLNKKQQYLPKNITIK